MQPQLKSEGYWEKAGEKSYAETMFASSEVERHVNQHMWDASIALGKALGLNSSSTILDLGCGDGAFTNRMLAPNFGNIDGFDVAETAIARAQQEAAKPGMRFQVADVAAMEYDPLPRYDGAFLIGILHHIKKSANRVVRELKKVTNKAVVIEPNGNHIARKLLEFTPTYRAAGEESFRTAQMRRIFEKAGWEMASWKRINLFPNFTPAPVFRLLRPLEPIIECTPGLRALCTVNLYGFVHRNEV